MGTAKPCLQAGYEGALADLHETRSSGPTGDKCLFRYTVKITGTTLDVGAGFVELVQGDFREGESLLSLRPQDAR